MIQNDIFLTEVYHFLKTATVKNEYLAGKKKADLEKVLGTAIEPVDNPYYLNLIGEYSQLDEMMYVTSIDTGETIQFTKANLAIHHKTSVIYKVPNDEFDTLVDTYPQQADLIKSILYPVADINTAINAKNFSLLAYDSSLLEEQEVASILDSLDEYLTMFRERWHINEFYYEAYYPITEWWMLWTLLPLVIFRQRIANIGTSKAHTSQIWAYLTANGLGDYRSVLEFREQMFLYKNLRYLIQNRGKDGTLSIMSEHLLYPRNLALRSKSVMLNTEDSTDGARPTAEFISQDIRDLKTPTEAILNGIETFEDMFEREHINGLEPVLDNRIMEQQKSILDYSKLGWLPTKLVEIEKINIYDEFYELYVNMMVETILYRISRGELQYNLIVPINEASTIPLTVQEAVALLFYTTSREFETKITLTAQNVDHVVGKNIILASGETVVVTDENKSNYIGQIVDTRSLTVIPTTAYITRAFKDVFPTIEQEFQFKGSIWRINKLIDYDDIFTRIETNVGVIPSSHKLLDLIDGHVKAVITDIHAKHAIANTAYQMAYDLLYRQLLAAGQITLDYGIPHTTYEEWFEDNKYLKEALTSLDNSSDVKTAYHNASNALIEAIIPVAETKVVTFDQFTSAQFRLIKQMFIQLCSYNIAFLDTERKSSSYIRFAQTVYHDKQTIDYRGKINLDPDPFETEVTDTIRQTIEVKLETAGGISNLTHSRINNFAWAFRRYNAFQPIISNIANNKLNVFNTDIIDSYSVVDPWTPEGSPMYSWVDPSDKSTIITINVNDVTSVADKSGNNTYAWSSVSPYMKTNSRSIGILNALHRDNDANIMRISYNGALGVMPINTSYVVAIVANVDNASFTGAERILYFNRETARFAQISTYNSVCNCALTVSFRYIPGGASNVTVPLSGGPFTGAHIFAIKVSIEDATISAIVDGVVRASIPVVTTETLIPRSVNLLTGVAGSQGVFGLVGETLIVPLIQGVDLPKIEGYLAHKWKIAHRLPAYHPYRRFRPAK